MKKHLQSLLTFLCLSGLGLAAGCTGGDDAATAQDPTADHEPIRSALAACTPPDTVGTVITPTCTWSTTGGSYDTNATAVSYYTESTFALSCTYYCSCSYVVAPATNTACPQGQRLGSNPAGPCTPGQGTTKTSSVSQYLSTTCKQYDYQAKKDRPCTREEQAAACRDAVQTQIITPDPNGTKCSSQICPGHNPGGLQANPLQCCNTGGTNCNNRRVVQSPTTRELVEICEEEPIDEADAGAASSDDGGPISPEDGSAPPVFDADVPPRADADPIPNYSYDLGYSIPVNGVSRR